MYALARFDHASAKLGRSCSSRTNREINIEATNQEWHKAYNIAKKEEKKASNMGEILTIENDNNYKIYASFSINNWHQKNSR